MMVAPPQFTTLCDVVKYFAYVTRRKEVDVTYCILLSFILNNRPPVSKPRLIRPTNSSTSCFCWILERTTSVLSRGVGRSREQRANEVIGMAFVVMERLDILDKKSLRKDDNQKLCVSEKVQP